MQNLAVHTKIGILAGTLFSLHALIPYSHAWPMIWQGIAAICLILWMKKSGKANQYNKVIKTLFQAGLISSAIFFLYSAVVFFAISLPSMDAVASFLKAEEAVVFDATLVFGLLIPSAIGIIEMLVVGSLTYLTSPKKIA